jgi:hypothetical protein
MRLTALKSTYASLMTSTSVVYADAFVDGSSVAGSSSSCTSWNSFYSSFELASISRQLLNLTFVSTKALSGNATVTSCSNSDSLTSLQEFATSGLSSTSVTCNSAKWSMQTCSNKFVFCANCSASLVDAVNVLSPCSSIVNSTCIGSTLQSASSSFARLLIATFVVETAPTIVSVQTYSQKQIITAYVTVNKAGAVFCGAWTSNRVPTSVQEIMQANNVGRATTGSNKAVNISMSALTPSTQYYVYCSTMSAHGTLSTLAQAMSSKVIVKTLCCKIITVNLLRRSVYAGSSLSALGTIAFTSGISDSLTLFVSSNSTSSTAPFFPQSLALTSTTSGARTIAFTGTATVGTVALSVSVSAAASSDYSIVYSNGNTVTVLSSQSKVPAPALLSAQFSNDGATVYLTFSGATNRGSTASNAVYFTCANMFNFRGVSSAQCQWSTDSTAVTIYPSPAYPLSIGSAVFMYASKVKSSCLATNATSCGAWPSNANANVTISAPGSAVKPSVLLALPSSIGSCDSLRIDIGGSSGSGGRAWSSTNFTVSSTASNVSLVAAYLKSNYKFGSPITVPRTLLQKGYLYTVSVTVCNFLGACGQATASVSVMNLAVPFAGIVGGPTFTATVNSSLQLSSTAYVASCDGSKSTLDLQYVWAVANGTSGASLSLTSKSRDPSKFILASYQLEPLVTYTFTLTVTSLSSLKSGSASVSVIVVQSDLIVVIAGGSERSVRALTSFSADASSSYDSDQANRGGVSLTYEWECWTISPEYLSDCLFTFSATNTSILASTAPSSSENSTSVLNLVIALSSRTANGQVFISVLSEQAPIVTVTSSQSGKVIVSNKLVLQGLVSTESDCNALWSISDPSIDLAAVSLVPPSKVLTSTSVMYLSIAPNALPVASALTLSLTCTSVDSGLTSSASVVVVTNSPPSPGLCQLSTYSGTELSTTFLLSTSGWIDSDIPIYYQFGFISPSSSSRLLIQTKSQLTFAQSTLPAGLASKNYSLTTTFQIYDNLGSSTSEYVSVQVMSSNRNLSAINQLTSIMLTEASGNVDSLKQTVSIISSIVNAVNCTGSPNCTALHRYDCSATPNTCGSCLSTDYVGINGDSNEACVSTSDAFLFYSGGSGVAGQSCSTDADCSDSWYVCDSQSGTCAVPNKGCLSNCSNDGGDCVFVVLGSLEVISECLVSDPRCVAQCQCNTGFYGTDCSLSETELQTLQDTIYQLLDALVQAADLELLDAAAVNFRTNSLISLTTKAYLVNDAAAELAYNLSFVLLSAAANSDSVVASSAVDSISGVVDNIFEATTSTTGGRRLTTASSTLSSGSMLDKLATAYTSQMVSGQDAQSVVMTNFRLVAGIAPTTGNLSVSLPQTSLEASANSSASSVTITNPSEGSTIGVTAVPLYILGSNMSYSNESSSNVTAAVMRISNSDDFSCDSTQEYRFQFAHYQPESFGPTNASDVNVTVTTLCSLGEAATVYESCPYGLFIPVHCDGNSGNAIVTVCPSRVRSPSCTVSTDFSTDFATCDVLNYTATTTTCRCSSCLFANTSSTGSSRRSLSSSSSTANAEASNVIALSTYTFTEYISVMQSASKFNSLNSLRSSALVIGIFAFLWVGTAIGIVGLEQYRQRQRRHATKIAQKSVTPHSHRLETTKSGRFEVQVEMQYANLEECLLDYIKELFSPTFSDYSGTARLFQELWNRHQYMSVLALDYGYQQWVGAFYLLTNLTANFFMLALFFDLEFPSDDGTCELLTTESLCVSKKSLFHSARTKCAWDTGDSICSFQRVHFDAFTTVVVSVIVLLVSVPISFLLSYTYELVLLAPSVSEIKEREKKTAFNMEVRRKTAINMMTAGNNTDASSVPNMRRAASTTRDIKDTMTEYKKTDVSVFSAVNDMNSSVQKASARAHQVSRRTIFKSKLDDLETDRNFKSFHSFLTDLRNYGHHTIDTAKPTPQHRGQHRLTLEVTNRIIDEFLAFWKPLLDDEDPSSVTVYSAAHVELAAVVLSAADCIKKLKSLPSDQVGVQIIELFVRDCLGRSTREATIFSQKVHPLKPKYVLTWGMKCFTFACLIIVNMYFIFACMLYAADKGYRWQRGWFYTCIVNFFVDVCINSVTMASVIYYVVPNLIVDKARHAKATVNRIVHQLCSSQTLSHPAHRKLSATAYYFVSMHVARAFPDLLESRIVLGYNSFFVSREQSLKINPAYVARLGRAPAPARDGFGWRGVCARLPKTMGVWITTCWLVFGSQSITIQQTIISMTNPGLVAVIALVGIRLFRHSFLGIPIGAIVILPILAVIGLIARYFINRAHADVKEVDDAHKNLTMHELELYSAQEGGDSPTSGRSGKNTSEAAIPGKGSPTQGSSPRNESLETPRKGNASDILSAMRAVLEDSSVDEAYSDDDYELNRLSPRGRVYSEIEELELDIDRQQLDRDRNNKGKGSPQDIGNHVNNFLSTNRKPPVARKVDVPMGQSVGTNAEVTNAVASVEREEGEPLPVVEVSPVSMGFVIGAHGGDIILADDDLEGGFEFGEEKSTSEPGATESLVASTTAPVLVPRAPDIEAPDHSGGRGEINRTNRLYRHNTAGSSPMNTSQMMVSDDTALRRDDDHAFVTAIRERNSSPLPLVVQFDASSTNTSHVPVSPPTEKAAHGDNPHHTHRSYATPRAATAPSASSSAARLSIGDHSPRDDSGTDDTYHNSLRDGSLAVRVARNNDHPPARQAFESAASPTSEIGVGSSVDDHLSYDAEGHGSSGRMSGNNSPSHSPSHARPSMDWAEIEEIAEEEENLQMLL